MSESTKKIKKRKKGEVSQAAPDPKPDKSSNHVAHNEAGQSKRAVPSTASEEIRPVKKRKKKRNADYRESKTLSQSISTASCETQAQWLWDSYALATGSSPLERAGLEESAVLAYDKSSGLENFLASSVGPEIRQTDANAPGSPLVLIIAASAVTANEFAKKLPGLNKICRIAKLFAKHFKVEEQQSDLSSRAVNIASGTPNRMTKLAESGHLKLDRLQLLLLDCALDAKNRTILDVPEVCKDLWAFFQASLKGQIASRDTRIVLLDSQAL